MPTNLTDSERRLRGSIAGLTSWANTADRTARTQPGRDAAFARYLEQVDPDHKLSPDERQRRAEYLRRADMKRLALKSAKARRLKRAS